MKSVWDTSGPSMLDIRRVVQDTPRNIAQRKRRATAKSPRRDIVIRSQADADKTSKIRGRL